MLKNITKYAVAGFAACTLLFTGCTKEEAPVEESKNVIKSFDPANMDTVNYKPGDDFYRYVNGTWLKDNPVPASETQWSTFSELAETNRHQIKELFAEIAAAEDVEKGSNKQKIRDLYNAGMDSVTRNERGIEPLLEDLKAIDKIKDIPTMQEYLNNRLTEGFQYIYAIYVGADGKNSEMNITHLYQSGLSLPNRDYYLEDSEQFKQIRDAYKQHVANMFKHIGYEEDAAAKAAETVLRMETRLAKAQMPIEELRNPENTYNKFKAEEWDAEVPNIDLASTWKTIDKEPGELIVATPDFMKEVDKMFKDVPVEDWKTYLKWHYTNDVSGLLDDATYAEHFNFYGTVLSGQKEPKPRWKRIQGSVSGSLGEAVGQLYVEKHFPPAAKEKMIDLVENLRTALGQHIAKVTWMSDETKAKAQEKLEKMNFMIGYPDEWKDYSSMNIEPGKYYENRKAVIKWSFEDKIDKMNKPVDKKEWHMPPQIVNAYYDPSANTIVFPAGILQPPYFNLHADDALNYGGIGVVIGHEMTHGFDDQGRKYDVNGNLQDWWTEEDANRFDEQAKTLVTQFDQYVMLDSVNIKGQMTLGENIADYGGLSVSLTALENLMGEKINDAGEAIDGFTPLQRFFISYAQLWRNTITDQALLQRLISDVHTPGEYRVNGGVVNIPEFYEAFGVKEGDKLYIAPENRAVIW